MTVPNAISLARLLILTPLFAHLMVGHHQIPAAVVLAVLGISDWADGYIARRYHQTSRLGAILDPIADRASLLLVALVLVITDTAPAWLLAVLAVPDLLLALGGAAALVIHGRLPELAVTAAGKLRTALLMLGVLLLVLAAGPPLRDTALPTIALSITLAGCLSHLIAATQYATAGWRALRC